MRETLDKPARCAPSAGTCKCAWWGREAGVGRAEELSPPALVRGPACRWLGRTPAFPAAVPEPRRGLLHPPLPGVLAEKAKPGLEPAPCAVRVPQAA